MMQKLPKSKYGKDEYMKKKVLPVIIVFFLILVIAGAGLVSRYIPTGKKMDLTQYYGQPAEGEAVLVLGTEKMEQTALYADGKAYLPLEIVNTYLNQRFYWDADNQQILYATPSVLETYASSDNTEAEVLVKDGNTYLSLDLVKKYTDIDSYIYEKPNRVIIQYQFEDIQTVTVTKNGKIRYQGGIKSPVLAEVPAGMKLLFLEELENWSKVATLDGYIGYIEKNKLSAAAIEKQARSFEKEEYKYIKMDEPINLVWHQVMSTEANANLENDVQNVTGVNVISPTWFSVIDNAGNISSIASYDYVEQAHAMGMQVWGLVDNFNEAVSTTEVLSHTSSRQNLIQQLIYNAVEYGIDGINVDFEYLSEDVGIHFLQFLRELSLECHQHNLVLSVDNPVPEDFTSHYDREEQGKVVDYVIIMGYDEHYAGSEEAGSVASLPWVEQGIIDTLEEVPAERVINAVPFYTRVWRMDAVLPYSEAVTMEVAASLLEENNADVYWDEELSQYYGTYEKEGSTYKVWQEEEKSIAEKVKLVKKYNLAGVAAWKLGLERSSVWQAITENLQ